MSERESEGGGELVGGELRSHLSMTAYTYRVGPDPCWGGTCTDRAASWAATALKDMRGRLAVPVPALPFTQGQPDRD